MKLQSPSFLCLTSFHLEWSRLQVKEKRDQFFLLIAGAPPETLHNSQQHKMHKTNLDSHYNFSRFKNIKKR